MDHLDSDNEPELNDQENKTDLVKVWSTILQLGLGELSIKSWDRVIVHRPDIADYLDHGNFYLSNNSVQPQQVIAQGGPVPTPTNQIIVPEFIAGGGEYMVSGVQRAAQLHTILPEKPRSDIIVYEVQPGDTIIGIAEKFNLKPETIFWGNPNILADDPHRLSPGQRLNILPVDGVYYDWHEGDGLNGVAEYFGVSPESIINYPGNHLSVETIGDFSDPNIEVGTWLIIEGGQRELINWVAPRITRDNPAVAKNYGPGYCGEVYEGPVGYGYFIWPTVEHWLSGYDYSPSTNHYGLDFAGSLGNAIYAVDSGVVVYAGWNDHGYGNMIVIDHGNGWQSLFAHLSSYSVQCGSYVFQGDVIGLMGSTGNSSGPHLHFELRSDVYGRVNPWNFLQ